MRALRIGGREENRQGRALGYPEEHRMLGTGGVHDRPDVVHALLEGRDTDHAVGHAYSTLVEQDEAGERSQPLEEAGDVWILPPDLDVADKPFDEHEVALRLTDDLVRDVYAISGRRIAGRRDIGHGHSLSSSPGPRPKRRRFFRVTYLGYLSDPPSKRSRTSWATISTSPDRSAST